MIDAPRSSRIRRSLLTGLKIALSLALLGMLLASLDRRALDLASRLPPRILLASLALLVCGQVLSALRLRALLQVQDARITLAAALRLTLAGAYLSNFTPGTVGGDIGKAVIMARSRVSTHLSVLAVLADRAVAFLTTVVLTATCVVASGLWLRLPSWVLRGTATVVALIGIALLLAFLARDHLRRLSWAIATSRLSTFTKSKDIVRRWLTSPAAWAAGAGLSTLAFSSSVAGQWLLLAPLAIESGALMFAAYVGLGYVTALIPISLNGLGVREWTLVVLLTNSGTEHSPATVLVLVTRLLSLTTTLPGALGLMKSPHWDNNSETLNRGS